jgi:antitoxin component HigA of HigAB toxin-antitoxin module
MRIKAIKNEQDHDRALKRLEKIFHAEADTPDGDGAEVLSILIEKYEDEHYPTPAASPSPLRPSHFIEAAFRVELLLRAVLDPAVGNAEALHLRL